MACWMPGRYTLSVEPGEQALGEFGEDIARTESLGVANLVAIEPACVRFSPSAPANSGKPCAMSSLHSADINLGECRSVYGVPVRSPDQSKLTDCRLW